MRTANTGVIAVFIMGREYVMAIAINGYPELSAPALRVFLKMASVVLDYDNPDEWQLEGIYYGGWKALAPVLGHKRYERWEPLPRNIEQKIWRCIRELRDAGLIVDVPRVVAERHPRNRVYRLNVTGLPASEFRWE